MLKDALKKRDFTEDAVILAKAANIIYREYIFCHNGFTFTGCFAPECQEKSLPASLKYLISTREKNFTLQRVARRILCEFPR